MCRNVTIFEKVERGNSMMERRRNNYLPSMKHYLEMIKVKKKKNIVIVTHVFTTGEQISIILS